ncbi:MAG: nickel pincer cofactor biosynthesis protein LarB [Selenomonadaceae bacterium]|nr:nickel pincer cofactor biosynthesis protein LarB [Selenomonadaceae bacterium]
MTEKILLELLRGYKNNSVSEVEILERLKNLPYDAVENLGFANVDHHRELRQGFPEVIYAEGKTAEQVAEIFQRLYERSEGNLIATRASREKFDFVAKKIPAAQYNESARIIYVDRKKIVRDESRTILILTAGTSDLPVAEEARLTAYLFGHHVKIFHDCGVAGIHRLFAHLKDIQTASVIIVVAGMEGALASVVGGLTDKPIIAVPTSVGYGASFHGIAALLAMLNSCAAGISVVNIDNGFGAAVAASKILDC